MDLEPQPRIVARGSWAQDEQGDLIYGPEGLPPLVAERLTEATQSLWSGGTPEPGRGYRIRSTDVWDQARMDYLAGDTAEAVCDRYGLKEGTLRHRAARDGWRRVDQADPDPVSEDRDDDAQAPDAPAPDYGDMATRALVRADRALAKGRAAEAASWLRLHARLGELSTPHRPPSPPAPPQPHSPDPFAAANRTTRAIIDLANQLGRTDSSDPIARAAVDAQFEAFAAQALTDLISDDSDDSDPVFSDTGSEITTDAPVSPKGPP